MFSKLFRREYAIDEAYMPIFLDAFEAVKANTEYDYPSVVEEILTSQGPMTPEQMLAALAERETPVKAMAVARARLKATKPKDIRFSANIHRRMIYLLEWREKELLSILALLTLDPTDLSSGYARASQSSHRVSNHADNYAEKVIKDLYYIYERFPDAKPYLAPIFEDDEE